LQGITLVLPSAACSQWV